MDNSTQQAKQIPTYASFVSFTSLLDWLKGMDHVPEQIDRSLWQTKFSGATGAALMSGCRFLGLLVDERPTPQLLDLVHAGDEKRKPLIEQMVRLAYGDGVVDRLPKMTPKMLDDHLRTLGATDATLRKAASFFINALKASGAPVPPAIAKKARNRPSKSGRRSPARKTLSSDEAAEPNVRSEDAASASESDSTTQNMRKRELRDGVEVQLVVRGNMLSLPTEQMEWLVTVVKAFDESVEQSAESEEAASI